VADDDAPQELEELDLTTEAPPEVRPTWLDRTIALTTPRLRPPDGGEPCVTRVVEGLWFHERELGNARGPRIPTRMAIVRLADGGLWVWSPLEPLRALRSQIEALGPVRSIVAPSTVHYLWAREFAAVFPAAELWASPGLTLKDPELATAPVLDDRAVPGWAAEFDWVTVGPLAGFVEVLCFHRATRTLFVADLGFHLESLDRGLDRWFWRAYGSYGRFGPSRLMRTFLRRDPGLTRQALSVAASWPLERIFVSHGTPISTNAPAVFHAAFARWLD